MASIDSSAQARFAISSDPHSHQSVEDSVHISWPQSPARSTTTRQFTGALIHTPISEAPVDSTSDRDVLTQQRSQDSASMQLFQRHGLNRSTMLAQPIQKHQSASTPVDTSHIQRQVGSQQAEESDNPHLYQMLLNIHHSAQPLTRSYPNENASEPDGPQIPSKMYSYEPQIASYRNQQTYNPQLPYMANDVLRSQQDIDHQISHNGQMAQLSMEKSLLRSQLEFPEIKETHNRQLARISMSASQCEPHVGFPRIFEAPIYEVDQMTIDTRLSGEETRLPQNRDIHNRQWNDALKSMHQARNRTEPPRTIGALNRQMALFATRDVHNDWQNGLQAGSRPAFWDQCRQNFGISQHIQSEPSARNMPSDFRTTTTIFPQLHLRPDYFRSQQFGALQGWPASYDEGAGVEPFLNPQIPTTPDLPSQVVHHSNAERTAYQSIHNQIQLQQLPVLPAPLPVSQTGPAAMHTLPPALEPSGFLSKPQLSSEAFPKATSDDLYATKQPPIGTPRASGPKLITTALERTTGQGQSIDNEPTLPSLPFHPGSDIMYPYAKENPSEALRRLTTHGRPSIDKLLDRDIVPFMKGGEKTGAVEWGVIRIGNVSISFHFLSSSHQTATSRPDLTSSGFLLISNFRTHSFVLRVQVPMTTYTYHKYIDSIFTDEG